jgi:hypothetical protein
MSRFENPGEFTLSFPEITFRIPFMFEWSWSGIVYWFAMMKTLMEKRCFSQTLTKVHGALS